MKKVISGFTIVELLIVIVVIAILATISIVAYTGVQARANNSATINGVAQYTKIFQMYAIDHGMYPDTDGYWPCLDATADGCGRVSGTGGCGFSGYAGNVPGFYSQLEDYALAMPTISSQTMSCGGSEIYRGAYVNNNTANRTALSIVTYLKGNVECPSSAGSASLYSRLQSNETTTCRYSMPDL